MARFKSVEAEEQVACNLIPMIDIMFLLLLFFMLSADMTQRDTEDITLPVANMAQPDPKQKDYKTITANLVGEGDNWYVVIMSQPYQNWDVLRDYLGPLAQAEQDPTNKPDQHFTSIAINLRADANAPYKAAQRFIQLCSKLGYYKIEVVASNPDAKP
jgi:biopolymer transport protein ExbD